MINNYGLRDLPGTTIMNSVTKEVYYTPPDGLNLIKDLLENLENYYNLEGGVRWMI